MAEPELPEPDEVAHLALQVGRLLLANGAEVEQVHLSVARLAAGFGCEASLLVTYEALLVTLAAGGRFRTKLGHRLPGMTVGMAAIQGVNRIVDGVAGGRLPLPEARVRLDALEHRPPAYPRWLVALALGATSASLARLFGGDWGTCAVAGLAGVAGTALRLALAARRANPVLAAFAVAALGGTVGGLGAALGFSGSPALCLVAPAMILVPGVPLINGMQDMLRGHVTLGMSRLGFAGLVVVAIALGVVAATALTGVRVPVEAPTVAIGLAQDALFSALAAAGYALLFDVPARMAWACAVCGVASHTLRALVLRAGGDVVLGTLIGAVAAGTLAQVFARRFDAPAAAFAFPGVVAMVPGAYAFRAVIGALQIARTTTGAPPVAETLSLAITVALMVGGIAFGVAAPVLLRGSAPGSEAGRSGGQGSAGSASASAALSRSRRSA